MFKENFDSKNIFKKYHKIQNTFRNKNKKTTLEFANKYIDKPQKFWNQNDKNAEVWRIKRICYDPKTCLWIKHSGLKHHDLGLHGGFEDRFTYLY